VQPVEPRELGGEEPLPFPEVRTQQLLFLCRP
jgi:hypothetical protein